MFLTTITIINASTTTFLIPRITWQMNLGGIWTIHVEIRDTLGNPVDRDFNFTAIPRS